jgi:hypothetical protein
MALRFVLVVAGVMSATGCERILGLDPPGHEAANDAGDDAPIVDGSTTDASPADMIDGFDTTLMDPANCTQIPLQPAPARCLIYAQNISLPAGTTLTIHGTYPVMLVAVDTVDIAGNIVVTANQDQGTAGGGGSGNIFEGGGGGGGGYGSAGGTGGAGSQASGSSGGAAGPASAAGLHGGMRGGTGGNGATGGSAGGAIWILGRNVRITGKISANGFAGNGAPPPGNSSSSQYGVGGGGGGSGGYIRIGAIESIVAATGSAVTANGGGGGEGSSPGTPGVIGQNGQVSLVGALGGGTGGAGGNGGTGAAVGPASDGYASFCGGGGGGGGAGYVIFHAPMKSISGTVSPFASP